MSYTDIYYNIIITIIILYTDIIIIIANKIF